MPEPSNACATSLNRLGLLTEQAEPEAACLSLVRFLRYFTGRIVPTRELDEGIDRLCMPRQFAPAAGLADAPQGSDVGGLAASVLVILLAEETRPNVIR